MRFSLCSRILLLIAGAVTGLALLLLGALAISANGEVQGQVKRDLATTGQILQRFVEERSAALLNQSLLLTRLPVVVGAVQTDDPATVADSAKEFLTQLQADCVVITNSRGRLLACTDARMLPAEGLSAEPGIVKSLRGETWTGVIARDGRLLLAVSIPIRAPVNRETLGTLTAYQAIQDQAAQELKQAVQSDVAFLYQGRVVSASLPLPSRIPTPSRRPEVETIGKTRFFVLYAPLPATGAADQMGYVTLKRYDAAMAPLRRMEAAFLVISAIALAFTLAIGTMVARGLTRPLEGIIHAAQVIRAGAWPESFASVRNDEIGLLQTVFDDMKLSVREKEERLRLYSENLESLVAERTRQIEHQAFHDALTGLPNRLHVLFHLKKMVSAERAGGKAILFLDLDNFKRVNDSLGHNAGDELLIAVAKRLQECVRASDMVARLGGDEFLIVLDGLETVDAARRVAESVIETMKPAFKLTGGESRSGTSVGIAYTDAANFDPDALIRDADTAMYQAKSTCKATYVLFEAGMNDRLTERIELEVGLHRALELKQFCVHYQPLIDLKTGLLTGVEALVRWQHPEKGLILPGKFIRVAEETGLIIPLGYWVMEEACRQAVAWNAAYPNLRALTMNVNLSGKQLQREDVVDRVREVLERTGLPAGSLKIEITESVMMEDTETAIRRLDELHDLGVKLALDDFGTGYSSMASLSAFPLDTIKIDQVFTSRLNNHPESDAVVAAIVHLAKSLNMDVTAEGVETLEQVLSLQGMVCDVAQGYYFSRPQGSAELARAMDTRDTPWLQSYGESNLAMIESLLAEADVALGGQLPKAA